MPNRFYPVVFMLSSTISLSITGLLTKYLTQELSTPVISLLRFLLPALILFVVMTLTKFRFPKQSMLKPLWVRAVCLAVCQLCFIRSLHTLSLVESVVLFSTGPLFIPLLEKLIFGVKMSWGTMSGLAVTFMGVVLLAGDVSGIHWRVELLLGILAGAFNAGSQLSLYRATKSDMRSIEINVWSFSFASVLLIPVLGFIDWTSIGQMTFDWHYVSLGLLLVVISVLVINTQVFRAKAYRLAKSGSQLAPLIFTNLLFSAIWQTLFFDVEYSALQKLGLVMIITATITTSVLPKLLSANRPLKSVNV